MESTLCVAICVVICIVVVLVFLYLYLSRHKHHSSEKFCNPGDKTINGNFTRCERVMPDRDFCLDRGCASNPYE